MRVRGFGHALDSGESKRQPKAAPQALGNTLRLATGYGSKRPRLPKPDLYWALAQLWRLPITENSPPEAGGNEAISLARKRHRSKDSRSTLLDAPRRSPKMRESALLRGTEMPRYPWRGITPKAPRWASAAAAFPKRRGSLRRSHPTAPPSSPSPAGSEAPPDKACPPSARTPLCPVP